MKGSAVRIRASALPSQDAAARRCFAAGLRRLCGIATASAVSAASRSATVDSTTVAPTGVAQYGHACHSGSSGLAQLTHGAFSCVVQTGQTRYSPCTLL